jgi:hypothetical protein
MSHIRCVKTGCTLINREQNRKVYGDLHLLNNDTYIFNACLQDDEADWKYNISCNLPAIYVDRYFERRGVIVFSVEDAAHNEALQEFFDKWEN